MLESKNKMSITFDDFVGKKMKQFLIHKNKDVLMFHVDEKWYSATAIGDCCSSSWYEHCDNPDALRNATISSFEDVDMGELPDTGFECILVNMLKFASNKGNCTIEFRNSSNGYYSGYAKVEEVYVSDGEVPDLSHFTECKEF